MKFQFVYNSNFCKIFQVSWIRQRDWHILSSGNIGTFTKDQRIQLLHVPNSHEWTLMIKYLQSRDEGTYVCQVGIGTLKSSNIPRK